jgi:predicted DNA binding CopG/RHH family protein
MSRDYPSKARRVLVRAIVRDENNIKEAFTNDGLNYESADKELLLL